MKANGLLILITLLTTHFGFSQETTEYKGKTYNVYPYKCDNCSGFRQDIMPYFGALEDGDYVMYEVPFIVEPEGKKAVPYVDSTQIAILFSIKDNKPHGMAYWLDGFEDTTKMGMYKNGIRVGTWENIHGSYNRERFVYRSDTTELIQIDYIEIDDDHIETLSSRRKKTSG